MGGRGREGEGEVIYISREGWEARVGGEGWEGGRGGEGRGGEGRGGEERRAGYPGSLGPLLPCLPPSPFLPPCPLPPSRPPLPLSILGGGLKKCIDFLVCLILIKKRVPVDAANSASCIVRFFRVVERQMQRGERRNAGSIRWDCVMHSTTCERQKHGTRLPHPYRHSLLPLNLGPETVVGTRLPRSVTSSNVERVRHLKTTANIT